MHRDRAGAFRPGALFSLHAARPSALHDLVGARPPDDGAPVGAVAGDGEPRRPARRAQLVQIDQVDSRYLIGATNWVGVDVPAHCTALGKVLYAFGALPLPHGQPGAPHRRTPRWTAPSSTTPWSRCAAAAGRRRWTSWSSGSSPSAPRSATVDGAVVAAVSVSGPTDRINEYGITELGDLLVAELRGLSALLGHQRHPASRRGDRRRGGMTDHAEILRGLYDETLVGNSHACSS